MVHGLMNVTSALKDKKILTSMSKKNHIHRDVINNVNPHVDESATLSSDLECKEISKVCN